MLDADEPKTCRRERRICVRGQDQALPLVPGLGHQSAIVERIGYEPATSGGHPPSFAEEDAMLGWDGRRLIAPFIDVIGKLENPQMLL
jgi:hypothetical protein